MKSTIIKERLATTPCISESVYENLPSWIKEQTDKFTSNRDKDVFLTSMIGMLSSCFPELSGRYKDEEYFPNTYCVIVAPPASGKSRAIFAKKLLEPLHDTYRAGYKRAMKRGGDKDSEDFYAGELPMKRKMLPGNISEAMFVKELSENREEAVIFEDEIDSLSKSFTQEWGNFDDELRKGNEHHTISFARKLDNVDIEVKRPKISMVLTGTPMQIQRLITSPENGLFSRIVFYCFDQPTEWKSVKPDLKMESLDSFFAGKGEDVKALEEFYRSGKFSFTLTEEQWLYLDSFFGSTLYELIGDVGEEAKSIVLRMGVHLFRIAMILCATRNWMHKEEKTQLVCSDLDFNLALELSKIYLQHSITMLHLIPKSEIKEHMDTMDKLYTTLGGTFRRCEAIKIGHKQFKLSESTIDRWLKRMLATGRFVQPIQGYYEKPDY